MDFWQIRHRDLEVHVVSMDIGFAGSQYFDTFIKSRRKLFYMLCTALTVELLLHFFLDNIPAFFCVRNDALGTVLHV